MLRCLTCGNEADQPTETVPSDLGHAYVAPPVFCAYKHPPTQMARLADSAAGEVAVTGSAPVPDPPEMGPGVRRDILGSPHSEQ